jgi:hypothetical protein
MSGRDTVRGMRASGALTARVPLSPPMRITLIVLAGGAVGALCYLLAVFVVPHILPTLVHLAQKPHPPAHYAKPAD